MSLSVSCHALFADHELCLIISKTPSLARPAQLRTAVLNKNMLGSEIEQLKASIRDQTTDSGNVDELIQPLQRELRYLRSGLRQLGAILEDLGYGNFESGPGSAQDAVWEKGGMDGPAVQVVDSASSNLRSLSEQSKKKASTSRESEERVMAEVNLRQAMQLKMEEAIKRAETLEHVRPCLPIQRREMT